jgi:cell division protein FtsL
MPALNYDYDYEDYLNARRARNKLATVQRNNREMMSVNTTNRKPTTRQMSTQSKKSPSANTRNKVLQEPKKNPVRKKINKQIDVPNIKPKELTLKKPKVNTKIKTNPKVKIANLFLVGLIFSVFFMICYRYSTINESFQDVQKIKSDIEVSKALNGQLEAEIASKTDLSYIENFAKYQLGMQKPSNNQIKRITLEKEDKITTPVNLEEDTNDNIFIYVLKEIRKILD